MMVQIDVAVGVLVELRIGTPWVLIARRPAGSVFGGFWELPGGKVEPGETFEECLKREFHEELGLTVRVADALRTIEHRYGYVHARLHAFMCVCMSGEPLDLQVVEHRWIRANELRHYGFPPANADLMIAIELALPPFVAKES
jgi:mutator protein MutT